MTESNARIRVVIADDHFVYRLGIRTLLTTDGHFDVVSEAATATEALEVIQRTQPDVVLLDLRMPLGGGLAVVSELAKRKTKARILIITSYQMEEEVFQVMQAGASGYVLKDMGRDGMVEAILAIHRGERWVPRSVELALEERASRKSLSPRELEVAQLMARGLTNYEIARVLSISGSTVKNHIYSLFAKLGVMDRTEAVSFCLTRGIVKADEL
jgi:DNA-binding NarL/FixJ family response regulator